MSKMPEPIDLASTGGSVTDDSWKYLSSYQPVIAQEKCDFTPEILIPVLLNILKNPNITSSHLFRADILYDTESGDMDTHPGDEENERLSAKDAFPPEIPSSYSKTRTFIRRLVPRNPQLDKPLLQTCHFFELKTDLSHTIILQCIPHVSSSEEIPWYHPNVKGLMYAYSWLPSSTSNTSKQFAAHSLAPEGSLEASSGDGKLCVQYQPWSIDLLPDKRLQRTALNLLTTVYKHGQGRLHGYMKKFHHDLLIPQSRVQDTYSALKLRHAKRLCDAWVEVTEPSKHVFEDLAIAAFLIELWRDMYRDPFTIDKSLPRAPDGNSQLPGFPGFVDIGCGNGVLTEILLCSGYDGWGFDARRRKTWSILSNATKKRLEEKILVPEPLLSDQSTALPEASGPSLVDEQGSFKFSTLTAAVTSIFSPVTVRTSPYGIELPNDQSRWHNGLFPRGTFIVSNHADELTAWTPLLASLSSSAFLAIPCCSHNLAGERFRAPSLYTNFTADAAAPNYFAKEKKQVGKAKHIAIHIPTSEDGDESKEIDFSTQTSTTPEKGDLKKLSVANRAKQPSAYSSLCDWVAALADEVGFEVEKENLRIPSTRNAAIIGRRRQDGISLAGVPESEDTGYKPATIPEEVWAKVQQIIAREQPNAKTWVDRARKLMSGKDDARVNHG